jgi:hypothetical protein
LKVSAGGARAAKATAVTGPTPGMVISRRAASFSFWSVQDPFLMSAKTERIDNWWREA